jgi:hypothetical protein
LFHEIQKTPYGEAVEQWLESTFRVRDLIEIPLVDQEVNVPHTGASFVAFLEETLRLTNLNIASGQFIVQPPSGLLPMVTARCDKALEQCLNTFRLSLAGQATNTDSITGREPVGTLEAIFRTYGLDPCLEEFDSLLRGFWNHPLVQTRRQELISTLRASLEQAESLRRAREEVHRRAQEMAAANARQNAIVTVSEEIRTSTTTGARRWRETGRKTRWHKLSRRDTVFEEEDAEYVVEVREKQTRGNGSVSYTDWMKKGTQWKETGAQRSYYP